MNNKEEDTKYVNDYIKNEEASFNKYYITSNDNEYFNNNSLLKMIFFEILIIYLFKEDKW